MSYARDSELKTRNTSDAYQSTNEFDYTSVCSFISMLQVTTIQKIIHSVAVGHTVLLCQTDKIHESFYDLFNQRFRSINDPKRGTQLFANIAIGAHSKPCRVDPKFQCFIVIDERELEHCPSPFLNRFEKYYLDHRSLFELQLNELPPCLRILVQRAYIQVNFTVISL